jgi:hypothetical protein
VIFQTVLQVTPPRERVLFTPQLNMPVCFQVSLFLRRIGLKQYVTIFRNYGVDGRALILLDEEDFENLYITNRVHIRKIQVGPVAACSEGLCFV